MQIPQIVTPEQCAACRGCCRFSEPQSDWSPRLLPDDAIGLLKAFPDGAWRAGSDRIALRACAGDHACAFLEASSHQCQTYASRPFECRLYPLLLSREKDVFKVYAHLACPAVEELRCSGKWEARRAEVAAFFARRDVRSFVMQNAAMLPDYSVFPGETEEICAFDPAANLWSQRAAIEGALAARPRSLSSLAFVNLFAWQDFFDFEFVRIDGALCILAAQPAGAFLYWPPLGGNITPVVIDRCFDIMKERNRGGSLTRIENVSREEKGLFDGAKYRVQTRGNEYVYDRGAIAALRGNDYSSRRGEVNAFERRYAGAHAFRPYAESDFNACAILFDRWLDARAKKHDNDTYRHMLFENRGVHRLALSHAVRLGLVGRVAEVDGRVVAYTFGYPLDRDTFCILFEIADLDVKGLPAFVFSRFCADEALGAYRWINVMDDFEAPDLARTKMSWRPARLEEISTVIPGERT